MAIVTWANPGTDGTWNVPANWTGGVLPVADDDVTLGGFTASYTVTLDITTPALDSLNVGTGDTGSVTLSIGANTLEVTGAGGGATDTITLNEVGGATIALANGTIDAATLNLNTANALVVGFGTLTFSGFVVGSGNIVADSGLLDITGGGLLSNGITFGLNDGATLKIDDALPDGALFAFSAGDVTDSTLALSNVGAVTETIANMNVAATLAATDKIDFVGKPSLSVTGSTGQTGTAGTVTLFDGTNTINLNMSGLSAANWFPDTASDGAGGTVLFFSQVACYARGTRILTEAGEVPVEDLRIGDTVVTFSGAVRPIRWIGTRAYDGRFIAGNRAVLPIRVAAGALSEGVPARDLFVSPAHSLYFDDVLVPAEHLVNGVTIEQAQEVDWLEYFHIELDAHDVIFAEGAPAETYVDCDNRGMFQNGADFALLYPGDEPSHWQFCAPRLEWDSEELTPIRARLLERAAALTAARDRDPVLHLVVDGKTIWPASVDDRRYRFNLPVGSVAVWLGSRSTRSEEHTSELQSHVNIVCRLLLEKKKKHHNACVEARNGEQDPPHKHT